MYLSSLPTLFFFIIIAAPVINSSPTLEGHFIKSIPSSLHQNESQQYFELTRPLPSDRLTPSCTHLVLHHNFANTVDQPPISVPYSPPSHCTWSHVVLEFRASCKGDQYDRIAAVWLAGAELLRTSTAEPTDDGVFWKVRKDVTRYSSLLSQSHLTLTVMLENVVNDVFTGVYHVNLSLLYYNQRFESQGSDENAIIVSEEHRKMGNVYETPADLIIPISGCREEGYWFRIQNETNVHTKGIRIPPNTWKAVLEVYVSFHGNDEFWYSNPPDSYLEMNNLTTGRGHGAYREVFVRIDGHLVGSVVPFPVVFTGGINPLFWEPVVAIGAFDVPSYDFDLTPFLGLLLDKKIHFFGLGVADSIPFWLVDANLHLWLDHRSSKVQAKVVDFRTPSLSIERSSIFKELDGSFNIVAKRKSHFVGWVKSSAGNLTTHFLQDFKFKNLITFQQNGTNKLVLQRVKTKTQVRIESDMGILITLAIIKRKYPLRITTSTMPGSNDTYLMITNVSHGLREKSSKGDSLRSVSNSQDSGGWMVVKDHNVLGGAANTRQIYTQRDEFGCYSRTVKAANGRLVGDHTTFLCAPSF